MDYIKALEEEKKKILVFERELPLSLQLITQAIETYKKQYVEVSHTNNIVSEVPVLEEFIPLRPSYSSSDEEINNHQIKINDNKKPDWLKSCQLWNEHPEPKEHSVKKPIAVHAKESGGAFYPFDKEKALNAVQASSTSNDNTNGGGQNGASHTEEKDKEKEGYSHRKARRCWSQELHQRFLNALQQLGGPHVATPKQIRELMKVDGLTNDEVKSHLQKFRLHNRRPTNSAAISNTNSSAQQPQIVLVGGIWVPPSEYTVPAAASKSDTDTRIYAPIASLPSQVKQRQESEQKNNTSPTSPLMSTRLRSNRGDNSGDGERTNSDSSATSSSTSTL